MELSFKNRFSAGITVVANEFIDQYMADANGEYVKVYLYLLRHERGDYGGSGGGRAEPYGS